MEISHAISDAVLTLTGLFVFFQYLRKLPPSTSLLWEAFVLSITVAAFFGVIRFLGDPDARSLSEYFQILAGTAGAICLLFVVFMQVMRKSIEPKWAYSIIALGFVVFAVVLTTDNHSLMQLISIVAIPAVLLLGIFALFKVQTHIVGYWLILAVICIALATYNKKILPNFVIDSTNLYHYLVALSLLCFGQVAKRQVVVE